MTVSGVSHNRDDYKLFIGGDPALKGDYFGICIHALPMNRNKYEIAEHKPWMPYLLKLFKLQAKNYQDMWLALTEGILSKYNHFSQFQIDYTTEKTIADFLEHKYGESRIIKTPFTKGESGSKMQLAQNSLTMIQSGYKFPDHTKIENPVDADNIRTLKEQIINEEVILNPDGSVKFRHKGPHNDLLHSWELSLDLVAKFIMKSQGSSYRVVGGPLSKARFRRHDPYGLDGLGGLGGINMRARQSFQRL